MASLDDNDEIVEKYAAIGAEPIPSESPEAFAEFMQEQYAWWGEILENPVFQE